jgi:hypothetical protein
VVNKGLELYLSNDGMSVFQNMPLSQTTVKLSILLSFALLLSSAMADETLTTSLLMQPSHGQDQMQTTSTTSPEDPTHFIARQPSILDELLNWQVPDLTQNDPSIATPKQYVASCNMLCSVGWEEDITTSTFTKRKVLRCNTANLTKIEFDEDKECDTVSGVCQRVLE